MGRFRNRGLTDDERARIAPGQHRVRNFPVLDVQGPPYHEVPENWDVRIWGDVARPQRWSFDELVQLPAVGEVTDIHCVTSWSKLDTSWYGVPMSWVLETAGPLRSATHVIAHAEAGYTANLPLDALRAPGVLLAYEYDGLPLDPEHGYPLRLIVPQLYFWKSAKWLRGLEFRDGDLPGFWERRGYSKSADPWKEERYAF
jgi:DMSO/TMAO reductase YedYZ molybdopterin-dependent catalytic subunit